MNGNYGNGGTQRQINLGKQLPVRPGEPIPQHQPQQTQAYTNQQYAQPQYQQVPQCQPVFVQTEKKKPLWKRILSILGIVVLVFIAYSCGVVTGSMGSSQPVIGHEIGEQQADGTEGQTPAPTEGMETGETGSPEKFTVTEEVFDDSNPYSASINGIVTNNTNQDYGYVSIEYALFDPEGNQIGTAYDNISGLKAGGTWKFSAMTMTSPSEIGHYERGDITAW